MQSLQMQLDPWELQSMQSLHAAVAAVAADGVTPPKTSHPTHAGSVIASTKNEPRVEPLEP